MALVEGHRRDAEQRPAGRRPGCEVGGVDAGLARRAPGRRAARYSSSSRRRVHALVVTTAAAAERTARSRVPGVAVLVPGGGRAACARARPGATGAPVAPAPRGPSKRSARRAARRRRRGSARRRRPGRRTTPRRVAASSRARRARAPTSRASRARGRHGGHMCCLRSAGPGRRCRRARRHAPPSQRPLVARPGDVRLVQRDDAARRAPEPRRPGRRRAPCSASRSATTRASASVEVFMPAKAGSSSRLR